ncbi:MAG: hypothetical protein WBI91_02420 [Coriobacteriia bacterium]
MREKVTVTSLASGAVTTTESVWEGGRLALERVTGSTGVSTYAFVYGPGSLPLELIVTAPGQQPVSFTYLCDRAGSVIALTDSAGAVVAIYAYDQPRPASARATRFGTAATTTTSRPRFSTSRPATTTRPSRAS